MLSNKHVQLPPAQSEVMELTAHDACGIRFHSHDEVHKKVLTEELYWYRNHFKSSAVLFFFFFFFKSISSPSFKGWEANQLENGPRHQRLSVGLQILLHQRGQTKGTLPPPGAKPRIDLVHQNYIIRLPDVPRLSAPRLRRGTLSAGKIAVTIGVLGWSQTPTAHWLLAAAVHRALKSR